MGRGNNNRIALGLAVLSLTLSLHTLAQSDNLELGAPGTADKVIDREGYALGYKSAWKTARWVTYRLTDDEVLNHVARRSDEFAPDPQIVGGPQLEDYRGSGYDRGHLAPAADMTWSQRAMTECFYLSNMAPQDRGNNGGIWNEIENTVRGFACAEGSVSTHRHGTGQRARDGASPPRPRRRRQLRRRRLRILTSRASARSTGRAGRCPS